MGKMKALVVVAVGIALLAMACQESPNLVEPKLPSPGGMAAFGIPPGGVFQSATFNVYLQEASGRETYVHRITDSWGEMTVTWGNFGGSFDPTVEGSFLADATGWKSVDVSGLVEGWLNGDYPVYGLLLEQGTNENFPFSVFSSKEKATNHPYMEICYILDGEEICEDIEDNADAYIWQFLPDYNSGASDILYAGWTTDSNYEKQALFNFDLEVTEVAAIGDFVWFDDNMNGIQDEGELGVPDVTVYLLNCGGDVLDMMTTDADGYYLFDNLEPGDYLIQFVAPEGYQFTLQDQGGDDAVDSDADVTTGLAWCTTLDGGETDLTWDAGIYLIPQEGCTLTIGFWKTHAGFGPQPDLVTQFLPIWLGTAGGAQSINVSTAQIAVNILSMNVYGAPSNGITKLYAQLLGAKLNIANGADGSDVSTVIANADAFLADHSWTEWSSLSKDTKKMILQWMESLDDYNNGDIGPGHCG